MYFYIDPLLLLSSFKCLMTYVSGEWIEIPAISSNYDDNYSKSTNIYSRPQYNKTYAFEKIVLKQSPTRELEPMITSSTSSTKNYHSSENLSSISPQPTQMLSSAPPLSPPPPPQKVSSTSPKTPQILSSTSPPPPSSPSISSKNDDKVNEENVNLNFKGIPGFLFTTRMKDIIMGVHKTLSRQPSHTIRGKLKYLEQIKNHLLKNIWERSRILWRGNSIDRSDSRSMSYFTSGEGPLITIALLTFAVFLIKIVQQFIQGLQGAAANTVGVQMPSTQRGRAKRWSDDRFQEATKMLHYMERYKFHNEL